MINSCSTNSPSSSVSFVSSSPSSDKSSDVKSLIHDTHLRNYPNNGRGLPNVFKPLTSQMQADNINHHYESIGDLSQYYFDVDDVNAMPRGGAHFIRPQPARQLNSFSKPSETSQQQQLILAPISYLMQNPGTTNTMCPRTQPPPPLPRHLHNSSNCLLDNTQYRPQNHHIHQVAPCFDNQPSEAPTHRVTSGHNSSSSITNSDASRNFYLKSLIV